MSGFEIAADAPPQKSRWTCSIQYLFDGHFPWAKPAGKTATPIRRQKETNAPFHRFQFGAAQFPEFASVVGCIAILEHDLRCRIDVKGFDVESAAQQVTPRKQPYCAGGLTSLAIRLCSLTNRV
jgi:hypothetical protein